MVRETFDNFKNGYIGIDTQRRRRGGAGGAGAPPVKGARGSEVPYLSCFYSTLATVFRPENTTEGTLCSKLTEIHLVALLPYQYNAST